MKGTLPIWPALLLTLAPVACATELRIEYPAIARILEQQVFTQEGRKYVRGSKSQRCNFAYLEHPDITGANGRLGIRAHFTGRSARNFFGRCVGLGDSFDVRIVASPYYRDGAVGLKDVTVESINRDGVYIRMVRSALAYSLAHDFHYKLVDDARKLLEAKREGLPVSQELGHFEVQSIKVTGDALALTLDFTLTVR